MFDFLESTVKSCVRYCINRTVYDMLFKNDTVVNKVKRELPDIHRKTREKTVR